MRKLHERLGRYESAESLHQLPYSLNKKARSRATAVAATVIATRKFLLCVMKFNVNISGRKFAHVDFPCRQTRRRFDGNRLAGDEPPGAGQRRDRAEGPARDETCRL